MICSSQLLQLPVCTAGGLYLHPTGLYFHLLALPFCATGVFHPPSERCLVYLLLSLHSDHFPLHGYCCERRLCALPPFSFLPSLWQCQTDSRPSFPHFDYPLIVLSILVLYSSQHALFISEYEHAFPSILHFSVAFSSSSLSLHCFKIKKCSVLKLLH